MQKVKVLYVCCDCAMLLLRIAFSNLEIKNVHCHKTGDDPCAVFFYLFSFISKMTLFLIKHQI